MDMQRVVLVCDGIVDDGGDLEADASSSLDPSLLDNVKSMKCNKQIYLHWSWVDSLQKSLKSLIS